MRAINFFKYKKMFNISRTLDDGLPFFCDVERFYLLDSPFLLVIFPLMIFV